MTWYERPRDPQEQHGFELIGAMIRRRRLSLGWSQRFLEAMSGIDQTVISRIENGKQYGLRWSRFAELVHALGGLDVALALWADARARPAGGHDTDPQPPIDRIDLEAALDDRDDAA